MCFQIAPSQVPSSKSRTSCRFSLWLKWFTVCFPCLTNLLVYRHWMLILILILCVQPLQLSWNGRFSTFKGMALLLLVWMNLGGRSREIFKSEFYSNQGCTVRPCLKQQQPCVEILDKLRWTPVLSWSTFLLVLCQKGTFSFQGINLKISSVLNNILNKLHYKILANKHHTPKWTRTKVYASPWTSIQLE